MKHARLTIYCLFSILIISCENTEQDLRKPNVLLILTDDQGYGDIAIHGNDSIDTPVQDRLAQEGIRLDNFYVSPVCAPTRASLLTGRYHYRTGTSGVTRNREAMNTEEVTLAEVFKANGYTTGCFGKWHNGAHYPEHPLSQGFDEFTGFCAGHWNNYFDPVLEANGKEIKGKGYITDIFTDSAMSFIQRNHESPFFCYVAYNTPHTPYIVPDQYFDKYKAQGLSDRLACTYGMVENMDDNIERMLNILDETGQLENTLIIFITDNGPNYDRYNGNMKGRKAWVTDGGVRVPSFWYWKGKLQRGRVIDELTAHIDVLPTLVELLNLDPVETLPLDGQSFERLFLDPEARLPERNFYTFSTNQNKYKGSVRTATHRLVIEGDGTFELTRLMEDRMQQHDLTDSLPKIASQLYEDYLSMYEEVTDGLIPTPPIEVGHDEAKEVVLPTHEGFFTGGINYKASKQGWANDWFTDWTSTEDTMHWEISVVNDADYQVDLLYTCMPDHTGAVIYVKAAGQESSAQMLNAFIPEITHNQERVSRGREAYDQTWGTMELGTINLEKGTYPIKIFATNIQKGAVGDVKAIRLTKLDP